MSLVTVNAGQCGNQLGFEILDSLFSHLPISGDREFAFRRDPKSGFEFARTVCLDTEPKAIDNICRESQKKNWRIDRASTVYRHGGAGNNWALGYQMCNSEFLEAAMDSIRKELSKCDLPPTLMTVHSLGGGTGSGLGTRLTEEMADQFSDSTRINVAITPYHFGEVIVQHYNLLLCLSKISDSSHGILLFENEVARDICIHHHRIPHPTLQDINKAITSNLISWLLPKNKSISPFSLRAQSITTALPQTYNNDYDQNASSLHLTLDDDISKLCCHPSYRFLNILNTPMTSSLSVEFTYDRWEALLASLLRLQSQPFLRPISSTSASISTTPIHRTTTPGSRDRSSNIPPKSSPSVCSSRTNHATTSALSSFSQSSSITSHLPHSHLQSMTQYSQRDTTHSTPSRLTPTFPKELSSLLILRGEDSQEAVRSLILCAQQNRGKNQSHRQSIEEPSGQSRQGRSFNSTSTTTTSNRVYSSSLSPNKFEEFIETCQSHQVSWMEDSHSFTQSEHCSNRYQRSICKISNGQATLPVMQRTMERASALFEAGAYLHQYDGYGISKGDFIDAFQNVGQIVRNYSDL